jgi:hypothetical protein
MRIQMSNLVKLVFAIVLSTLVGAGLPAIAAPGLGISVSFEKAEQTDAEVTGSIWVGGDQGSKLTRTILVRSLSDDVTQAISFDIYDQILVNDQITTDTSVPSRISDWVTFSPAQSIVRPGDDVRITMTIDIPNDAADGAFDATLRVRAGAVENLEEIENEANGVKAVVGTSLAIDSGMWLGVGDALALMPNFEIIGVDGVLLDGRKYVRVFFENTGLVPLRLSGRLQLADAAFAELVYDPIDFLVPQIRTNQQGYVDVPVQPGIEDGNYRSFVIAQHGGVRKTEIFEGQIVFDDPNALTLPDALLRGALFLVALGGLVFGYRMIRSSRKGGDSSASPTGSTYTRPRFGGGLSASVSKQALLALGVLMSLGRGIGRALMGTLDSGKAILSSRASRKSRPDSEPKLELKPSPFVPAGLPIANTQNQISSPQVSARVIPPPPLRESPTPPSPYSTGRPTPTTPRPAGSEPRPLYPYWYQPPTQKK